MQNAVSQTTQHAPRAFTLIELLIVVSIIAVLAALTFPAVSGARISILRARSRAELAAVESAIERYNQKLGYYPPDNPQPSSYPNHYNWAINQLYYELLGTTNVTIAGVGYYQTLDGSAQIATNAFQAAFGPTTTVAGFMNCSRGGGDGLPGATAFLTDLKPSQFLAITNGTPTPICTVLGSGVAGPLMYQNTLGAKLNPWCYNSSSPQYNPKSFDLWIDVTAGSKTNRICNWSDKPLVVDGPYP
jgi:prepilin-type N-terminal cleavage/methylation domain-containing protein